MDFKTALDVIQAKYDDVIQNIRNLYSEESIINKRLEEIRYERNANGQEKDRIKDRINTLNHLQAGVIRMPNTFVNVVLLFVVFIIRKLFMDILAIVVLFGTLLKNLFLKKNLLTI